MRYKIIRDQYGASVQIVLDLWLNARPGKLDTYHKGEFVQDIELASYILVALEPPRFNLG